MVHREHLLMSSQLSSFAPCKFRSETVHEKWAELLSFIVNSVQNFLFLFCIMARNANVERAYFLYCSHNNGT